MSEWDKHYAKYRDMYIRKAKEWRARNWPKAKAQLNEQKNRNPNKRRARGTLKKAVHDGRIIKPTVCSICLREFVEKRFIHGHHNDYSKPHEVVWVCAACHPGLHKAA